MRRWKNCIWQQIIGSGRLVVGGRLGFDIQTKYFAKSYCTRSNVLSIMTQHLNRSATNPSESDLWVSQKAVHRVAMPIKSFVTQIPKTKYLIMDRVHRAQIYHSGEICAWIKTCLPLPLYKYKKVKKLVNSRHHWYISN